MTARAAIRRAVRSVLRLLATEPVRTRRIVVVTPSERAEWVWDEMGRRWTRST